MRKLLHLGSGPLAKQTDWEDYDGSWNAKINAWPAILKKTLVFVNARISAKPYRFPLHVRYLDLNRPLPFQDDQFDAIYASHVWEHLYHDVALERTRDCFRVLKPGGVLRIVVPDLSALVTKYLSDPAGSAAIALNQGLMFRGLNLEKSVARKVYTALTDFHSHKFMYDVGGMIQLFEGAGFSGIAKRQCFESRIGEISQVESQHRCGPGVGFAVEGEKQAEINRR